MTQNSVVDQAVVLILDVIQAGIHTARVLVVGVGDVPAQGQIAICIGTVGRAGRRICNFLGVGREGCGRTQAEKQAERGYVIQESAPAIWQLR